MPVSVIVGAQYGSEGKGKVALEWALKREATVAVRVGGPNSGHTIEWRGETRVFRQLPTAAILPHVISVIPPGAYLDVEVLLAEIDSVGAGSERVVIDPRAVVVTQDDVDTEKRWGIGSRIGSTVTGTGAAVARRVRRDGTLTRAGDLPELRPYLADTLPLLHEMAISQRIIIEGTQGYGLSLLHGLEGDFATSRDTTAAGFLSETGLSPLRVDEVVLVARAYPIRVAGNSGSLPNERSWTDVGLQSGRQDLIERTTVTHRVRRVGEFDPEIVKRAIYANAPTTVVLNHVDYVTDLRGADAGRVLGQFVEGVEAAIGRSVDFLGYSPSATIERHVALGAAGSRLSL